MLVAQMVSVHVMAMRCGLSPGKRGRHRPAKTVPGRALGRPGPARFPIQIEGAQPLSQQWRACHHRAERVGRGWRQGHRRQCHAAMRGVIVSDNHPAARGDGLPGWSRRPDRGRTGAGLLAQFPWTPRRGSTGHERFAPAISVRCWRAPRLRRKKSAAADRAARRRCAAKGAAACHGGAPGSGAPRANQNARRHGLFTGDAIAERKQIQGLAG